jgi:hypothetical protein
MHQPTRRSFFVRQRRGSALLCLLFSFVLVAAACGGKSNNNANGSGSSSASETPTEGGDVTFGAEQEPDCMDWIASCSGAAWGVYTVQANTMPRSFDFNLDKDGKGTYTPSALLSGEPKLTTSPTQTVEYVARLQVHVAADRVVPRHLRRDRLQGLLQRWRT